MLHSCSSNDFERAICVQGEARKKQIYIKKGGGRCATFIIKPKNTLRMNPVKKGVIAQ